MAADFKPDVTVKAICLLATSRAKDTCKAAGCSYNNNWCHCSTQKSCTAAGAAWAEAKCGDTVNPLVLGYSSCACLHRAKGPYQDEQQLSKTLSEWSSLCCGGKPTICAKHAKSPGKKCFQDHFCKSKQYVTGITHKVLYFAGSARVNVGGKCVDCPTGATCDGTAVAKCGDKSKYLSGKAN